MKRLRISRCTGQLLNAQARTNASSSLMPISFRTQQLAQDPRRTCVRSLFTNLQRSAAADDVEASSSSLPEDDLEHEPPAPKAVPSPLPEMALSSAKLAALHARLSLPEKLPLQTLARCLVDPSADPHPNFNNANLAFVGYSILAYHTSESLICRYPRLPMAILYEAMRAYSGTDSLYRVAQGWGVEDTVHPGEEVDPGLLQWSQDRSAGVMHGRWGYVRKEHRHLDKFKWRRGMSSRIVYDDEFGDVMHTPEPNPTERPDESDPALVRERYMQLRNNAHAAFVRAVAGGIYAHCGRDAARSFVDSHVLSRKVDLEKLFKFRLPTRELAYLCAREGFEAPLARLESETGRASRTPVFVVGIYSGRDKLGEGTGPSLDVARLNAAMNTLKAWYLYSPGNNVRVPSDMLVEGAKPWQPVHIDPGEII